MKFPLVAALALGLGAGCLAASAQDAPRQLGGAPVAPAPRPVPPPPPRPLEVAPAASLAADSVRPTPVATTPAAAPATAPASINDPSPFHKPYVAGGAPQPVRYQVGLRQGTVYNATDVEVKAPLFGHDFLLLNGQQKIDLNEVAYYETETGHYVRTTLPGSARLTTLRREKTGRISLYATYSTTYASPYSMAGYGGLGGYGRYGGFGGYPYGGGYRNTTKTEYFSKENGPIQSLTARNLTLATTDNAGAQALLAQARHYQQGATLAYIAGGGLLVAGFIQSFQPGSRGISPLLYAAIPVLVVPLVFQSKQAAAQRQAIALYNSGR